MGNKVKHCVNYVFSQLSNKNNLVRWNKNKKNNDENAAFSN